MKLFYEKYIKYKLKYLNLKSIKNIKYLTKLISIPRPIESDNLRFIKNIVMDKLKELNLIVEEQKFNQHIRNKSYNFSNIIAYNKNTSSKYILLGAHIDSCDIDNFHGSIDSASSIAIILELANKILTFKQNYPLMIVFFDGEEAIQGKWTDDNTLIGSRYFVKNYDISKIEQLYLLDLIGGDIENKFYAYKDNPLSEIQIKKLFDFNKKYDLHLFVNPSNKIQNNIIQDDHIPFKKNGIKYLHLIPIPFPKQHHKITDTYENLNWTYIEIFTKVLFEYLIYL